MPLLPPAPDSSFRHPGRPFSNPITASLTIRELIAELAKVADAERDTSAGHPDTRMSTRREQELIEELHRRRDELPPD